MSGENSYNFYDLFHLREAWLLVKQKGARGGIDGVSLAEFERNVEKNLAKLSEELETNRYIPEPYQRIYTKQVKGEPRALGLPTVRDKIVQMAVKNCIEPIFNVTFLDCSYAYRPNKGHRKALRRVEHYLEMKNLWVTTCDIDNFFDSLNHDILMNLVKKKISDERILRLISLWLKIGIIHGDEYRDIDKGVPQGGIISPLLSNIYLHPFDEHMVNRKLNLVRYADDFIILTRTRLQAEEAHELARNFLETQLKLKLNPVRKKAWHVKEGFVFLGLEFRGYQRTIAPEKFEKALMKIQRIFRSGDLQEVIKRLNESISSWRYYYGTGNTFHQFQKLERTIQEGLISLVHKQLAEKKISSKEEAKKILMRLDFLIPKKFHAREQFVNSILTGKIREKKVHREKAKKKKPATVRAKPKKVPTDIQRDIIRKKKKYQRRQATGRELVISEPGYRLGKMYQRIVVRKHGMIVNQIPSMRLKYIMITTRGISLSSDVIRFCAHSKIPIDFLDIRGQPIARLTNPHFPRYKVGLAQLEAFINGKAKILAKTFVEAKVRNQLNLIKYYYKYRKEVDEEFTGKFYEEEARMEGYLKELAELTRGDWKLDEARGQLFAIEGRAASSYWSVIRELIKDEVRFERRVHRGARDLFNSLLNYGYGILYSRVWQAILRAGLNPTISYLHVDQPKKGSLVFDLIEEFRPQAVDRVIISMISKGVRMEMNGKYLSRETCRKVIQNVLERLNVPIKFRDREMSLAEIIHYQAKGLALYLEGKKSRYWPFIGKW